MEDGLWRITWQENGFAKPLRRWNDDFGSEGDRLAEHEPSRREAAAPLTADPGHPAVAGCIFLLRDRFRAAIGCGFGFTAARRFRLLATSSSLGGRLGLREFRFSEFRFS